MPTRATIGISANFFSNAQSSAFIVVSGNKNTNTACTERDKINNLGQQKHAIYELSFTKHPKPSIASFCYRSEYRYGP
jgi:hypothetical protein